jgi:ATP-dependent Clp endopeptidase proteolytic subunit ClpP
MARRARPAANAVATLLAAMPPSRWTDPTPHPARAAWSARLSAHADTPTTDVYLYDAIGGFFGIRAAEVVDALREARGRKLRVHINSPGGDVFDGLAIFNALREHDGPVETVVDGLAASIASIIALAGRPVTMHPAAFYMVHEPHGFAMGQAADMRKLAALLDKAGDVLADVYAAKTGQTLTWVHAAMLEETWYTADEAADAGFIDEILPAHPESDAAPVTARAHDLSMYGRVPDALRPTSPTPVPAPVAAGVTPPARMRERAAVLSRSLGYLVGV